MTDFTFHGKVEMTGPSKLNKNPDCTTNGAYNTKQPQPKLLRDNDFMFHRLR